MKQTAMRGGMSIERLDRIGPALTQHISERKLSGVVTTLYRHGETVDVQCHGYLDREQSVPMRPDAVFRIFSMTKPITVAALMTLVERGHVRLADPVHTFIPSFRDVCVLNEAPDGIRYERPARDMTVKDLLTHTSGLTYHYLQHGEVERRYRSMQTSSHKPLGEFVDDIARQPLAFQPGSQWRYSVAIDVVARIVEIVTGEGFESYLRSEIFDPIGMVDTGFFVPESELDRFSAEYGYGDVTAAETTASMLSGKDGDEPTLIRGAGEGLEASPHQVIRGGHGLVSTIDDYLRFCRMLLGNGAVDRTRVLGRKSVELMTTNQIPDWMRPIGSLNPAWGFGLGMRVLVDLGLLGGLGTKGEYGWSGAAGTYFWIDPAEELIGIYMTQFQPGGAFQSSVDFRNAAYQAIVD